MMRRTGDHLTLGAVIEAALAEAESSSFWDAVAKEHAALTPHQTAAYVKPTPWT